MTYRDNLSAGESGVTATPDLKVAAVLTYDADILISLSDPSGQPTDITISCSNPWEAETIRQTFEMWQTLQTPVEMRFTETQGGWFYGDGLTLRCG